MDNINGFLRVVAKAKQTAIGTQVDPISLEVFNNLYMAIAEQMGVTLQNVSYSVNIKERLDFSCALFDPEGHLLNSFVNNNATSCTPSLY